MSRDRRRLTPSPLPALLVALLLVPMAARADEGEWPVVEGEAFTLTEVRPGLFHAVGTGAVAAGSNGAVLVAGDGLLLVDSHMSPAAARALLAELPAVSELPVRWVVNTHFHFDHVHGNQVYGPEVEIIAHEVTRRKIADGDTRRGRGYDLYMGSAPERIAELKLAVEAAEGEERAELEAQLAGVTTVWEQNLEVVPTPPTMALREAVTLYRGGREIRLLHLGKGHTAGDVVVYLPAERAAVTGDLVTAGLPYMGDAYLAEWVDTLGALQALELEVILPGHGPAFAEVERVGHLRAYLADLWRAAHEAWAAGDESAESAAERIDLTAHADHFPQIDGPGVHPHAVERVYELLDAGYEPPGGGPPAR